MPHQHLIQTSLISMSSQPNILRLFCFVVVVLGLVVIVEVDFVVVVVLNVNVIV